MINMSLRLDLFNHTIIKHGDLLEIQRVKGVLKEWIDTNKEFMFYRQSNLNNVYKITYETITSCKVFNSLIA